MSRLVWSLPVSVVIPYRPLVSSNIVSRGHTMYLSVILTKLYGYSEGMCKQIFLWVCVNVFAVANWEESPHCYIIYQCIGDMPVMHYNV